MRLGWTTGKYSITYRAVKTVRINGKNKTQIVKSFVPKITYVKHTVYLMPRHGQKNKSD